MRALAVDQGTTSTRALRFAPGEPPREVFRARHRQSHPRPGWVEHDPREILAHVAAAFESAGEVDVAGLANQGESCLAWDRLTGEPLSPILTWQDSRTLREVQALKAAGAEAEVRRRAGVPLDPYFSASKLAWLLRETPGAQAAHRALLLRHLTGVDATDATTASRTSLMDLATLSWDPDLCALFGVPMETLAPIRPTMGDFGEHRGVPVRASAVDQQASLYGHGCRRPGEMKMTFGTGAFALAILDGLPTPGDDGGLSATVAWSTESEVVYALEGGVYDAGAAIEWAMRVGLVTSLAELDALEGPPAVAEGLLFVPALSGLGAPHSRRDVSGAWLGLTSATTRTDMQKAILEGVAFQCACVLDAMIRQTGGIVGLSIDGGLAANRRFAQLLADVTGLSVRRALQVETTGHGIMAMAMNGEPTQPAPRLTTLSPTGDFDFSNGRRLYEKGVGHLCGWR